MDKLPSFPIALPAIVAACMLMGIPQTSIPQEASVESGLANTGKITVGRDIIINLSEENAKFNPDDIEIVEASSVDNVLDVKIANFGSKPAFIRETFFVQQFAYEGCCQCAYYAVLPSKYDYLISVRANNTESRSLLPVHSLHPHDTASEDSKPQLPPFMAENCPLPKNEKSRTSIVDVNDEIFNECLSHYEGYGGNPSFSEIVIPGIKMSQVVPPNDVDRILLSFNSPLSESLGMGDYLVISGYLVFLINRNDYTCTDQFHVVFKKGIE